MALSPGQRIDDRYTILELLGEGGVGAVYAAQQISTGQRVAVKVLHESAEGAARKRFEREMRLIAGLRHPNIVRLIDSGALPDDSLFTVMEFIEGEDLAHLLAREGSLDPYEARRFMSQVLDALSSAHASGVIHRDLKPHNIMITGTGARRNAVVLDFGIAGVTHAPDAATVSAITAGGGIPGTPAYMAPEQIEGQTSPRSDLYSWGLVYIECLSGETLVTGTTPLSAIAKHLKPGAVSLPDTLLGRPEAAILERAIAFDPAMRFASAREAFDALERLERSGATDLETAPGRTPARETDRMGGGRSSKLLVVAIVLVVLLIGIAIAIFVVLGGSDDASSSASTHLAPEIQRGQSRIIDAGQPLREVAWVAGSSELLVGGERGLIAAYDANSGDRLKEHSGFSAMMVGALAVSPSGSMVAAGGMGMRGFFVRVFRDDGTHLEWDSLSRDLAVVEDLAFSSDSSRLAVGAMAPLILDTSNGEITARLDPTDSTATGVAFTPDDREIFVGGADGMVVHYDVASRQILGRYSFGDVLSDIALSPDGAHLAASGLLGKLLIWEVGSRDAPKISVDTPGILSVDFSPDGRVLAAASRDGAVRLYDPVDGALLLTLEGHRRPAMKLAFHPTEPWLASASQDGTARIWTLRW